MQDPPIFTRLKEKHMNDERQNDVQDPAEPYEVGTEVETKNTDVAAGSSGTTAGTGAVPTAREQLRAQEAAEEEASTPTDVPSETPVPQPEGQQESSEDGAQSDDS
jgi:hypothetical protein